MINFNEEKLGCDKDLGEISCIFFPERLDFKEIFDITLDLDYLIEVWHEEKNINKAVKKLELKYKEGKNGKISK